MVQVRPLIIFMSDFGVRDPYVGIVHGVVESLSGGTVKVIDLVHELPAFSVLAGAYALYVSYKYFPHGSVFLAVVDPGVGSDRKAIALRTKNYYFVGPNNGVLWPAASEDGIVEARVINNEDLMLKPVSRSFHGRDVFAPAAVHIALGGNFEVLGEAIDVNELERVKLIDYCGLGESEKTRVVYIDRFGNVALGLRGFECWRRLCRGGVVRVCSEGRCRVAKCSPVFSVEKKGTLVLYINSFGFLELAVNLGSAREILGVDVGSIVVVEPIR